jgi:hypothetical protein
VPEDETKDAVFEALWAQVLGRWDDDRAHAAALDHSVRAQQMPELAGRYRALLEDAARAEVAKKRLDAIVAAATSLLMATQTPRPQRVPLPITLSAAGVSAVLLGWLAWALWGPR